jgi:hypothetical protein
MYKGRTVQQDADRLQRTLKRFIKQANDLWEHGEIEGSDKTMDLLGKIGFAAVLLDHQCTDLAKLLAL